MKQFVVHLARQLHARSQKQNSVLVELSLLNDWFGLSWNGRQILRNTGIQLAKSTYREKKKKLVQEVQEYAKNDFNKCENACVLWLDNFNDIYIKGYTFGSRNGTGHKVMKIIF